jgi:hypothetical protein
MLVMIRSRVFGCTTGPPFLFALAPSVSKWGGWIRSEDTLNEGIDGVVSW